MKSAITVSTLLLMLVAATGAGAQTANPAGMAPDTPANETGRPPAEHANTADQLFVRQASLGGMAEVDFGKLALQKASSGSVKAFALQMVDDHEKANDKLIPLAKASGVPLRKNFDMDHQVMRTELAKASGNEFDVAYIRGQVQDHQKTAQLLEWEIGSGQDPRVRNYAMAILPTVLAHLEHAQLIQAELTGAGRRL
jgi:putative membrane protein